MTGKKDWPSTQSPHVTLFLFSSFHYPCCATVLKGKIAATQHKQRMALTQAADVILLFGYIRAVLMGRPQTGKTTHLHSNKKIKKKTHSHHAHVCITITQPIPRSNQNVCNCPNTTARNFE